MQNISFKTLHQTTSQDKGKNMKIFILTLILSLNLFANASDAINNSTQNIKDLNELNTLQNERIEEILALNKNKVLELDRLTFLYTLQNELLMNQMKIKAMQ